jgi:hypothetical protein
MDWGDKEMWRKRGNKYKNKYKRGPKAPHYVTSLFCFVLKDKRGLPISINADKEDAYLTENN